MRRQSKTNPTKTRSRKPAIKRHRSTQSNDQLKRELDEAREEQAATADVLRIVSASSGDLKPVFQALLNNAVRICEAKFGILTLYEGGLMRHVAMHNLPPAYAQKVAARMGGPGFRPHPESMIARALSTKRVVHTFDYPVEVAAYKERDPTCVDVVELGGVRTLVSVPMLKENTPIGTIQIFRQEVRPFTDKQIALVQNFAAQAVIAIENGRLLNELHQRTADLTESLEQQTATSQVLSVISSSPAQLQPVFQAILANATRLCGAKFGTLYLREGDGLRVVALHGAPLAYAEERQRHPVIYPGRTNLLGQAVATKRTGQIADVQDEANYMVASGSTGAQLAKLAGARTVVAVPMVREDEPVGVIVIYRQEVRPFSDKQVELLTNFAAQAVIAIENARLLNELRERTDQLEAQSREVVKLNQQLEQRVADQVGEIERMGRLRRFLPPQVADLIVASGTEKQLESHRREITALFCDLRGFTGFSESSDPEDVMALLREYHAAIGEIIIKYSGTLERFAGDGVMVIFNDPVPVPNPALQAVRMALDMRVTIGALIERWRRLGHDLGFGIGIAHGFATLGTIGFEGRFDYAAIGTVSNVASRLCDEAKPGQILISPRVLLAVEDAVTVEAVGDFELKGIRRPVAAYNVLDAKPSN
jgi:class 3 adenylate cyclase/putative methionine-R-sulfoxide reductase with GAF domain